MSDKTTYILEFVVLTFLAVLALLVLTIWMLRILHEGRAPTDANNLPEEKILNALDGTESRLGSKIDGVRQHHDVNLDSVASDTRTIRRTVEWIRHQWEKFSRPGGDGR